jgi:hypothetical protein
MIDYKIKILIILNMVVYVEVVDDIDYPAIFSGHLLHIFKAQFRKMRNFSSGPIGPYDFRELSELKRN